MTGFTSDIQKEKLQINFSTRPDDQIHPPKAFDDKGTVRYSHSLTKNLILIILAAATILFLDGLQQDADEKHIRDIFKDSKGLKEIRIGNKELKPNEFRTATVSFHSVDDAIRARYDALHYLRKENREVKINYFRKPSNRGGHSGGSHHDGHHHHHQERRHYDDDRRGYRDDHRHRDENRSPPHNNSNNRYD